MTEYIEGQYQVCTHEELHRMTSDGWMLVAVLPFETPALEESSLPNPHPRVSGQEHWQYRDTLLTQHVVKVQQPRFLLVYREASAIRDLTRQIETERAATRDAQKRLADGEKALADLNRQFQERGASVSSLHAELRKTLDTAEMLRTVKHKLEADIAKIRTAVGELKLKEILEGKAP